jgi:hypothetical protein
MAPWRIRWGLQDVMGEIKRQFRCSVCGQRGCTFDLTPRDLVGANGLKRWEPEFFPSAPFRLGGERLVGESYADRDRRVLAEYLAKYPSGDALAEFRGGPAGPASMCGKFTAMASWAEVVAFSQPLGIGRPEGGNDRPVTYRVMSTLPVIIWDGGEVRPFLRCKSLPEDGNGVRMAYGAREATSESESLAWRLWNLSGTCFAARAFAPGVKTGACTQKIVGATFHSAFPQALQLRAMRTGILNNHL